MYQFFKHGEKLQQWVSEIEGDLEEQWKRVDAVADINQLRVLRAFRNHKVSDFHFTPSTGYGYDDVGRDVLEQIYAEVFGGEAALVRPHIVSGTHAIAIALFGLLRPNDELMYITGKPYDTLETVIGIRGEGMGSLKDFGISYSQIDLTPEKKIDWDGIRQNINAKTKVVAIQRSRGYGDRPSFTIQEIGEMIRFVKEIKPDVYVFVDNCYGEFVETLEPCHVGADLIAGSLIKNPGGGIVKSGGYLAGKKEAIEKAAYRMAAPGIGGEGGAMLYSLLEMYQGLFLAPHIVGEALKGAIFTAKLLEHLGFKVDPTWDSNRTDLIQSVQFDSAEKLITFCQGIQKAAPVDAHVIPTPSPMPGYKDDVIMAAGTFIQGASIELTADGPIRPPYLGFIQGGLTLSHVKVGVLTALDELLSAKLL